MYESGMWKNEIAESTGISEGAVGKYLAKLGIPIANNRADAMSNRISRMTDDEIAAMTAPAHEAVRGMKRTDADLVKRAKGKERVGKMVGQAEKDLYALLIDMGLSPIPQKAVWKYNIDFMLNGNIAVEVTGRNRKPSNWPTYRERIKYLLNGGFALVYVWANTTFPIEIGAAEYLVSFCEKASRDPSVFGKYWVIRRDGKLMTTGGMDNNDFPGILTSVSGTYART
jgi:predicted transcriptional regulator